MAIACHYSCQHGRFGNQKAYPKLTYMWAKYLSRGIEARKISTCSIRLFRTKYSNNHVLNSPIRSTQERQSVTSRSLLVRILSRHRSIGMRYRERDGRSLHAEISYKMRHYEGRWVECKLNARLSDASLKRKSTKTARQHMSSNQIITRSKCFLLTFIARLQSEMKSNN